MGEWLDWAPDLKTGDIEFKSLSDHWPVPVRSQLLCHLPVRILNLLSLFQ